MGKTAKDVLERSSKSWALLAQASVWVIGVIAGFLLPPPVGTPGESKVWVRFAQFVVTIVIGLMLLGALRWKRKRHAFRWGWIALGFLVLGTAAFFGYQLLSTRWTAPYDGERVIIGGPFTEFGKSLREEHPRFTNGDLVMAVTGKVEKVWTRESIEQRRLLLAALYVLAMPLFTVCIISIVQAVQCASEKVAKRRRARSSGAPAPG